MNKRKKVKVSKRGRDIEKESMSGREKEREIEKIKKETEGRECNRGRK